MKLESALNIYDTSCRRDVFRWFDLCIGKWMQKTDPVTPEYRTWTDILQNDKRYNLNLLVAEYHWRRCGEQICFPLPKFYLFVF